MRRWGDPDGGPFAHHRFGGDVDNVATFDGVTIAASGRAGWWWGTPRHTDGEFFRYRITRAVYVSREHAFFCVLFCLVLPSTSMADRSKKISSAQHI